MIKKFYSFFFHQFLVKKARNNVKCICGKRTSLFRLTKMSIFQRTKKSDFCKVWLTHNFGNKIQFFHQFFGKKKSRNNVKCCCISRTSLFRLTIVSTFQSPRLTDEQKLGMKHQPGERSGTYVNFGLRGHDPFFPCLWDVISKYQWSL